MIVDLTQRPTALFSSWSVQNKWVHTGVAAGFHPTAEHHRCKRLRMIDASIAEGNRASERRYVRTKRQLLVGMIGYASLKRE